MRTLRRPAHVAVIGVAITATGLLWVAPLPGLILWGLLVVWTLARAPGAAVTLSWAGFWLYLGSLDLLGIETRSRWSAIWYLVVAAVLAAFAWTRRNVILDRLRTSGRLQRLWIAGSILLGLDFALGAAVVSGTSLGHKLLAVYLVSTIPATIAAAGLDRRELGHARLGLILLGVGFAIVDLIATRHGGSAVSRFSPIASFDPISSSLVASLGCAAALTLPRSRRRRGATLAAAATCLLLAGAAQLHSARGPLIALGVAILVALATRRGAAVVAVVATVVGIAIGTTLEPKLLNQPSAIGSVVQQVPPPTSEQAPTPISSIHIREEWIRSALRQFPDRPIVGHGIGVLVDDTPEAARMGVKGQLIYPHNNPVEAAYSLGSIGLALYGIFTLVPLIELWRHRRDLDDPVSSFCAVIFAFAFVESNFSGEIGTDVLLWSASCLVVLALRHSRPLKETP